MKGFGWLLIFGALTVGSLSTPAQAQSSDEDMFDLKDVTCRDLLKTYGEDQEDLLILMHGYVGGQMDDSIIDGPVLAEATDNIVDACIDDPDSQLLSVFETYR